MARRLKGGGGKIACLTLANVQTPDHGLTPADARGFRKVGVGPWKHASRALLLPVFLMLAAAAQDPVPEEKPVEFVCPMDPDVRGKGPAKCPRCGMALVPGIPDFLEFPVRIESKPRVIQPGADVQLTFEIYDPRIKRRANRFELMHEKLFHLFLVSQDLQYFAHEHPTLEPDSRFRFETRLPKPGMYRVLSDFYPAGSTPQLVANTLFVSGKREAVVPLREDVAPQKGSNLDVSLTMEPKRPIAGFKTLLFFDLSPADGLEPYLGAWGHMMAASEDLVDMIHTHPFIATGGPRVQFNLIFPRPGMHRVWVQFQRKGVVNTVAFNIPVAELK